MNYVIEVLEKAEYVLMKRISKMREGSPKWGASDKLREIRTAIGLIKGSKKE